MTWRARGVYAWRCKKPHAPIGLPFIGRHWAYCGQSNSRRRRDREHLFGSVTYGTLPASWSDLAPKVYSIWILFPGWRRARLTQEWLWIKLLMPVYNDQHNRTNPRRISREKAARQRAARDKRRAGRSPLTNWTVDILVTTARLVMTLAVLAGLAAIGWEAFG